MAQLTRVDPIAIINFHRYRHKTTQAIVIVECSDQEYADLGLKGAGPPPNASIPLPQRDYEWIGSSGGVEKYATDKYGLAPGEMTYRNPRYFIRPHDVAERTVVTDPVRDTITGDPERSDTTITISPDPVRYRGGAWKVENGDMEIR